MPRWKQGAPCGLAGRGRARSLMFGFWTMVWACQIPPICLFRSLRPNRVAPALDSCSAVRLLKHTAANSVWRTAPTRGAVKRDCDCRFSGGSSYRTVARDFVPIWEFPFAIYSQEAKQPIFFQSFKKRLFWPHSCRCLSVNPHSAPIRKIQPLHRVCSFGLLLFSGLIAWATPSALAQSSPQDTAREDVRPKTEDTGNLSTNTKRDIVPASNDTAENKLGLQLFKKIARDQRDIWTSPAHMRLGHATWLVPFAGVTAGLMVTDRDTSLHLSNDPNTLRNCRNSEQRSGLGCPPRIDGAEVCNGTGTPWRGFLPRQVLARRRFLPVFTRGWRMGSGQRPRARVSGALDEDFCLRRGHGNFRRQDSGEATFSV